MQKNSYWSKGEGKEGLKRPRGPATADTETFLSSQEKIREKKYYQASGTPGVGKKPRRVGPSGSLRTAWGTGVSGLRGVHRRGEGVGRRRWRVGGKFVGGALVSVVGGFANSGLTSSFWGRTKDTVGKKEGRRHRREEEGGFWFNWRSERQKELGPSALCPFFIKRKPSNREQSVQKSPFQKQRDRKDCFRPAQIIVFRRQSKGTVRHWGGRAPLGEEQAIGKGGSQKNVMGGALLGDSGRPPLKNNKIR